VFGGFILTLPCDREAAVAALDAAIAAARRQMLLTSLLSLIFGAAALGFLAAAPAGAPGIFGLFGLLMLVFVALIPLSTYMQVEPWLRYLEELRDGLREGRIRVEDVCGRPLAAPGRKRGW